MKHCRQARLSVLQLDAKKLREEVVEAIPGGSIVERHEEQVRAGEAVEQLVGALLFEDRIT